MVVGVKSAGLCHCWKPPLNLVFEWRPVPTGHWQHEHHAESESCGLCSTQLVAENTNMQLESCIA